MRMDGMMKTDLRSDKMPKKSWAKGRKEKCGNIQVSQETLEMARTMAEEAKMTIKDFMYLVLDRYASRSAQ